MAHVFVTSAASDGIRKKPREHGPLSVILLGLLAFSRGFVNIFFEGSSQAFTVHSNRKNMHCNVGPAKDS